MDNSLESYSKKMQSIDITGSGWDQNIELSLKEHQIQLRTLVEQFKEQKRSELSTTSSEVQKDKINDMIAQSIENIQADIAGKLKDSYVLEVEKYNSNLQEVLYGGFEMTKDEIFDFLCQKEKEAHQHCLDKLKVEFQRKGNETILKFFENSFCKDEKTGKQREWVSIEETTIKTLFDQNRTQVDAILRACKNISFPTGLTKVMDPVQRAHDDQELVRETSMRTTSVDDLINQNYAA